MIGDAARYGALMRASTHLTPAEEQHLLDVVATHSDTNYVRAAESALLRANSRFVFSVVMRYTRVGSPICDDLFIAGCSGLLHAIREYRGAQGANLRTYAVWWIRQRVLLEMKEQTEHLSGVNSARDRLRGKKKEAADLVQAGVDVPAKLQEDIDRLAQSLDVKFMELDRPGGDDGDILRDLPDIEALSAVTDPLDVGETNMKIIEQLARTLSAKHRAVIDLTYGVDCGMPLTFEEIGAVLLRKGITSTKLSRERVRQIKLDALKALRKRAILLGFGRDSFQPAG